MAIVSCSPMHRLRCHWMTGSTLKQSINSQILAEMENMRSLMEYNNVHIDSASPKPIPQLSRQFSPNPMLAYEVQWNST